MSSRNSLGIQVIAGVSLALLGCKTTAPQGEAAPKATFADLTMTLDC